jgi:signal transduction histidine kinase/flagellar biosynthesis/type III secretory pathway chaperone
MLKDNAELPTDVATLQQMVKELQEDKFQRDTLQYQQTAELERLYQQVTGQPRNPQWSLRDYALAIYDYLDNIIALAPGHIFWLDRNNFYLGCNNTQAKSVGLSSRYSIVGKTNADLYAADQANALNKANLKVMQTGKLLVLEEPCRTIEGDKNFLSEKVPLRNKDGEIIGILGTALDITEQKNTIAALEKIKQQIAGSRHEQLFHSSDAKYISATDNLQDMLEKMYKLEEANKQSKEALVRSLEENQRLRVIQNRETMEFSAIYYQVTGQVPQLRFTLRDYALAIYHYLDNIISLAPGHIFWLDRNNVYLGCNEEHAQGANLSTRGMIVGKTNADLIWADKADVLNAANNSVMELDKPITLEESAITAFGEQTYLSRKVPLHNEYGQVIGLVGTSLDITDQKQAMHALEEAKKKAEEASWAKSEFIQNMSHDLKTPLTTIMGMTELLALSESNQQRKERLMHIHHAGKRMLDLFTGILDVASLEAGSIEIKQEEIDIRELMQGMVELYQPIVDQKQLYLKVDTDPDTPLLIKNDKMRLQRILLNLIGNALKFTEKGGVTVHFSLDKIGEKNYLLLRITDTGIGISVDKLQIIFEKFVRLNSSYQGQYSGTGLGLSIVKRFVEELDGTIVVESEENNGTSFICRLPLL